MHFKFKKSYNFLLYSTIIIGLSVSIWVGWFTYYYYTEKQRLRLELASNEIVILVQARMAAYEQVLKSGVGFFNASDSVSRHEWAIFIKGQKLNEKFKGIQGVGYSEVVSPKNKQQHEARIRKEGFPNFKIYPDGQRNLYTSIIYLEPFNERNIRAFGYDMLSEKVRREAMIKAMQSGKAVLSGKIKLVQEYNKDIQAGFLMYLPVYKKGFILDTPQDKAFAIQGFVYAPFRATDLMNGILGKMFPNIEFEIYDGSIAIKDNILYSSNANHKSKVYKKINRSINERVWTITFKTNSVLESENVYIIFLLPGFVLILTFFLYLLLNSLVRTKEKALQIAKKATRNLHTSEERLRLALEGTGDGVWDWYPKDNIIIYDDRWANMLGVSIIRN